MATSTDEEQQDAWIEEAVRDELSLEDLARRSEPLRRTCTALQDELGESHHDITPNLWRHIAPRLETPTVWERIRSAFTAPLALGALTAVALLGIGLSLDAPAPSEKGFQARSGTERPDRFLALRVLHDGGPKDGQVAPPGSSLSSKSSLSFAFRRLDAKAPGRAVSLFSVEGDSIYPVPLSPDGAPYLTLPVSGEVVLEHAVDFEFDSSVVFVALFSEQPELGLKAQSDAIRAWVARGRNPRDPILDGRAQIVQEFSLIETTSP